MPAGCSLAWNTDFEGLSVGGLVSSTPGPCGVGVERAGLVVGGSVWCAVGS
jgi:hypothetical protein